MRSRSNNFHKNINYSDNILNNISTQKKNLKGASIQTYNKNGENGKNMRKVPCDGN